MLKNLIILIFICITGISFPQLKSISILPDYSFAPSKRLEITRADAVGGIVNVRFNLIDNLNLSLKGGYKLYSLNEPDVLATWNWQFWSDRYYNRIVSDLNADPNLSVEIGTVQKMDLIPVSLIFDYKIDISQRIAVSPSAGGGVMFFTRRMYAVENWSKFFPEANYTFSYSYRNFAPDKKGNPFFISAGLLLEYNLFKTLNIFGASHFNYIIPADGSMGYDEFPFSSELSFNLGISILY